MASTRHERGSTPDRMVALRVFESADGGDGAVAHFPHTARVTFREARAMIERFVGDGYVAIVRRANGTGGVVRSVGPLPRDVRSIVVFRTNRGR